MKSAKKFVEKKFRRNAQRPPSGPQIVPDVDRESIFRGDDNMLQKHRFELQNGGRFVQVLAHT